MTHSPTHARHPINSAEAVFEPFFDRTINELSQWTAAAEASRRDIAQFGSKPAETQPA
jgi:hypothetical protein